MGAVSGLPTLYHYTCDHGHKGIGTEGYARPLARLAGGELPETARWLWLTDMATPDRDALGLTSQVLACDRLAHRYRVTRPVDVHPWVKVRRLVSPIVREALESAPGARPKHWYVSRQPQSVVLDERADRG